MTAISAIDKALALVPKVTGSLSFTGSIFVFQDVVRDEKKRKESVYHRIMMGLSIFDAISSVTNFLSTWPIPSDHSDVVFLATGTTATCTAQGFFAELGNLTTVLYTAALTLRYVLFICYNLSEIQLQRYEPLFHGLPILIGLTMAVVGLPFQLYNNSGWLCWYAVYPRNCDVDRTCERGAKAPLFQSIHYSIVWTSILFVTFGMLFIYITVRRQETRALAIRGIQPEQQEPEEHDIDEPTLSREHRQRNNSNIDNSSSRGSRFLARLSFMGRSLWTNSEKSSGGGRRHSILFVENSVTSSVNPSPQQPKRELRRSNEVAAQARLYIYALYLTWLFTTITRVYQMTSTQKPYVFLMLMAIFFPLQGFWNCFIYVRPVWVQRRQEQERNADRIQKRQELSITDSSSQDINNLVSSSAWESSTNPTNASAAKSLLDTTEVGPPHIVEACSDEDPTRFFKLIDCIGSIRYLIEVYLNDSISKQWVLLLRTIMDRPDCCVHWEIVADNLKRVDDSLVEFYSLSQTRPPIAPYRQRASNTDTIGPRSRYQLSESSLVAEFKRGGEVQAASTKAVTIRLLLKSTCKKTTTNSTGCFMKYLPNDFTKALTAIHSSLYRSTLKDSAGMRKGENRQNHSCC
ncbi:hypothetical protein IV203_017347 [Nitzschia inconspicua]|uniref:G-protein coupled receptors family 2 profile 2 domain-containing protein n=1 Tax=Nitzschia inconspicua TaxID=303405 RepID=A0A9K3PIA3_9STRA|nr:hypothetical protein IV203_017347 [Nitzschia inconspicua]